MTESIDLQRTPLHSLHREIGARLVPFAGWEMPVQYTGIVPEHRAVRGAAGLFDVSHMGEVEVRGPGAVGFLQKLTPNDVSGLQVEQAHYSALLTHEGTFIDDLLVYRLADERFMLVVNAANTATDLEWMRRHLEEGVELEDVGERTALLALQGPRAAEILTPVAGIDLSALRPFRFREVQIGGAPALVSRTGYTGEDGFEIYLRPDEAAPLFRRLLEEGRPCGLLPVGLGARDTLRLEAALCLSGQDIDATTTPLEAGLSFMVKLEKGQFIGRDALLCQRDEGVARRLTGFRLTGRGVARHGHAVMAPDGKVSVVTSGSHAPTLGRAIGLAYLPPSAREPGTPLQILIRERPVEAEVVPLPFYRRPRS